MKCRYCKAEIPEGELYCKKCGREVQIVPDYNPLEEMLTAQIQLDGNEQESELDQYINQKRRNNNRTGQSAGRNTGRSASRTTAAMTGRRMTGNTTGAAFSKACYLTGRSEHPCKWPLRCLAPFTPSSP